MQEWSRAGDEEKGRSEVGQEKTRSAGEEEESRSVAGQRGV